MLRTAREKLVAIAAGGSALLLTGAFAFQYIGGLSPCQLCLYQRWPHAAAVLIGAVYFIIGKPVLPALGAMAALITASIGTFHVGVEQKWWKGLASCTASSLKDVSATDLLNPDVTVGAVIRCDAIAWQMFGISMAGWNAILSIMLALVWLRAAYR
ncbi:MAG: disulfide bond formation protein B [Rhodobacteraceae bacterium]|nr:disulfide bond formation protein B [Paracoccaceae bacterium]